MVVSSSNDGLQSVAAQVSRATGTARLMLWRSTLHSFTKQQGYLESNGQEFCALFYQTLPLYTDKRSVQVVLRCLSSALANESFLKTFASAFVKSVLTGKASGVLATASSCSTLVRWGCQLLRALQAQPALAKAAQGKVLEAISAVVDVMYAIPAPERVTADAVHKLATTLHADAALRAAALQLLTAKPLGAVASALAASTDGDVHAAVVAAYVALIAGAKEKVPAEALPAWGGAIATFSAADVEAIADKAATMVKRSADTALSNVGNLFADSRQDLSAAVAPCGRLLVPLLKHSKDEVVGRAAAMTRQLAQQVRDAGALTALAQQLIQALQGGEAKTVKDRVTFARTVQSVCPDCCDRREAERLSGDVRESVLADVVAPLAAFVAKEAAVEARVTVIGAAEAWLRFVGLQALHACVRATEGGAQPALAPVPAVVADCVAAGLADKAPEVRSAALRLAAAAAMAPAAAQCLAAVVPALLKAAKEGAAKAALRADGVLALAGAAGACGDVAAAPAVWDTCRDGAAELLTPRAIASLPRDAAAYAACLVHSVLGAAGNPAPTVDRLASCLANLAIANSGLGRTTALAVVHLRCRPATGEASFTLPFLRSLWAQVDLFPGIPGADAAAAGRSGDDEGCTGAKVIAPRVETAAAAAVPELERLTADELAALLRVLHHPVCLSGRHASHALDGAKHVALTHLGGCVTARRGGEPHPAIARLLPGVVAALGKDLDMANSAAEHSVSAHMAAQHAIAAAVAVAPAYSWASVVDVLTALLDRTALGRLTENEHRIYETPRGKLMVEVFQATVAPDELFADGTLPAAAAAPKPPLKNGGKASGKGGGKVSKEDEARAAMLAAEDVVRVKVEAIRRQLALGLAAMVAVARHVRDVVGSHMEDLLPLALPLARRRMLLERCQNDPSPAEAGAFDAIEALAGCLPLQGVAAQLAAALQLCAAQAGARSESALMALASYPAMTTVVHTLHSRVLSRGALKLQEYCLIFPVVEAVLSLPARTPLHEESLVILTVHVDAGLRSMIAPHLRLLFYFVSVSPQFAPQVKPLLVQLLSRMSTPEEVAAAMGGVVLASASSRGLVLAALRDSQICGDETMAALLSPLGVQSALWLAVHDVDSGNAAIARELWAAAGGDVHDAAFVCAEAEHLANRSADVRQACATALGAACGTDAALLAVLCRTVTDCYAGAPPPPALRAGCGLAVKEAAPRLSDADAVLSLMEFVLERGLTDADDEARRCMLEGGTALVDAHGASQLQRMMPLIERYLENNGSFSEEQYDHVRTGAVVCLGGMAQHLQKDDPKIPSVVAILKDVLSTPSEQVQVTVSNALTPLASKLSADEAAVAALISYFLATATTGATYGARRGAAYGLAGFVKGLGIVVLKKHGIMDGIKAASEDKGDPVRREGAMLIVECLCMKLGRMFEPYIITVLPLLLASFGDSSAQVRESAQDAARVIMANLSGPGVKLVLPTLLKGLNEKQWRTKQGSIQLLGAMSHCGPQQLASCLASVVPALSTVLADPHPKVQAAAEDAIAVVGGTIRNPEVSALSGVLIKAIADPLKHTKRALEVLRDTVFVHTIDVSSLALILPVITRGLKERGGEAKKQACRILGNLASLVNNPRDLAPYVQTLLPELKNALVDPLPEVRATAARALGSLVRGLGQEHVESMMPWLLSTLQSDSSPVERSGAALGLAEVVAVLGAEYLAALVPSIVAGCGAPSPIVREGNLTLLVHLPVTCRRMFETHLKATLPCILGGLADEAEGVRDSAMAAGMKFVELYAVTSMPLLLPAVEAGMLNENWRIRECSVKLLGELLFKIAGTTGKVRVDGDSDDEGAAVESYSQMLLETLGASGRNDVLAKIYLVRCDVAHVVRNAAVHVWKSVVVNTPRTLREVLPRLLEIAIEAIAGDGEEGRQMASRCFGELVRKMGDKILAVIVPTLTAAMASDKASTRQGVCFGIKEVLEGMTRDQLAEHLPTMMPAVQTALCDEDEEVRTAAGEAFSVLFKGGAGSMIDGMIPALLEGLAVQSKAAQSVEGLRVILSVRPALLASVLPKLLATPLQVHNVAALGPLVAEASGHLAHHLAFVLPRLLAHKAAAARDEALRGACNAAALQMALALEEEGTNELVRLSLKLLGDPTARAATARMVGGWVCETRSNFEMHKPAIIASLLELFADDDDPEALAAVSDSAKAVLKTISKDEAPSYVGAVRKALGAAHDTQRRKDLDVPVEIPGLCLPKALEQIVEVYLLGLLQGSSSEVRENAALALGEMVSGSSAAALKPYIVKVTGPLIRIVGDRFPPPVKLAILRTLGLVIGKAGAGLKPFVPQLQTTFLKCLPDPIEDVRMQAARNLGDLAALMATRVDQLAMELANSASSQDAALRETFLTALCGVLANAGAKLTSASLPLVGDTLTALAPGVREDDETLAVSLAGCIGEYCGVAPPEDAVVMLEATAMRQPLPAAAAEAFICAVALAAVSRQHSQRLADFGLLQRAVAAAERMLRHSNYNVRVAATRTWGRLSAWGVTSGRTDDLDGLTAVLTAALGPDQAKELHMEALHQLRTVALLPGGLEYVDSLMKSLLPCLCSVVAGTSGQRQVAIERALSHLLQVHDGIQHARELASEPGMGPLVKSTLTEPYLKKLATIPLTSSLDATHDEDF